MKKRKTNWARLGDNILDEKKTIRNWAGLPNNILDDIVDRLVDLSDYIRFASVCPSWRLAALDDRNHRGKKSQVRPKNLDNPQLPMLMLPHWSEEYRGQFYSVTTEKILNFQLPVPYYSKRLIGSSCGWLISVDTDFAVTLFNPFSASTVRLPPVLNSDVRSLDDGYYDIHYFNHEYYFVKAILSADPALHPNEYVVLLIYGDMKSFAYIRPGATPCWRYLELPMSGFCDVVYSKSSHLFYALRETGEVCSVDIDKDKADCFTPALEIELGDSIRDLRYIVETRSDGLLQVIRFLRVSDPPFGRKSRTGEIKVFKLDKTSSSSTAPVWVELKSLGDNALFVGDCTSICVTASDYPGCRPGSVYFSLPYLEFLVVKVKPFWDRLDCDFGVANIEGKRVEPLKMRYRLTAILDRPPIWVVPTFRACGRRDRKDLLCNGDTFRACGRRDRKDLLCNGD